MLKVALIVSPKKPPTATSTPKSFSTFATLMPLPAGNKPKVSTVLTSPNSIRFKRPTKS